MPDEPFPASSIARRIESFRNVRGPVPLHLDEKRLLSVLGLHLAFFPWALGTMHAWSQCVALGLGILGFATALRPRSYEADTMTGAESFRLVMWPKLVRFPIFWIGLTLLIEIVIQALNPSWRYTSTAKYWWLMPVKNISWLPSGVEAPFERFNAWRQLIIYADTWLLACSVWVGLTRRRSLRILLLVIAGNALALGMLLGLQHTIADGRFPWPLTALTDANLTGSFIYRNHAGAYMALTAFPAVALAVWFLDYGEQTLKKSTPAGALGLAALIIAGTVPLTLSRGSTLMLGASAVVIGVWFYCLRKKTRRVGASESKVALALAAVFAIFLFTIWRNVDFSAIAARFDELATEQTQDVSVATRLLARHAATDMLRQTWVRGVGAGGFRYLFSEYVRNYPEIYQGGSYYWEHAHCDWLEIPIELGVVGDALLVCGAGWWAWYFVRRRILWNPAVVPLLLGCAQTLVHASFDFPFQCPAILGTWCVLLTIAGKWVESEKLKPEVQPHQKM